MFYKLLTKDNKVETIGTSATFYKYSETSNRLIRVNPDIANRVKLNGRLYNLQGLDASEDITYIIVRIDEEEYNLLKATLEPSTPVVSPYLKQVREEKLGELCKACQATIIGGCDIVLSRGTQHFKFTNEDQMNITRLMNNLQLSRNTKVLYHSSGNRVEYYSAADFNKIYTAMHKHITYHTTYFNLLKNCINNMYNPLEIKAISYGYKLTNSEDIQLLKQIRR